MHSGRLWIAAAAMAITLTSAPAHSQDQQRLTTKSGPVVVQKIADGLVHPWGLTFLPDGRMLVTERPGRLRLVGRDGTLSPPLAGVPKVFAQGQGGLLDVALHPNFQSNRLVYLSFAEPGAGGASTAVARGRLTAAGLEGTEIVFRQRPKVEGPNHFGSRLAFAPDGSLYVTLGERFKSEPAQDLTGHLGKVVRIMPDGTIPPDNPFVGRQDAAPEIWSYGHRNSQGAAIHPQTGRLWMHEHGPRGGDEINLPEAGRNYGWPLVSWGKHYSGENIPDPPTRPDLANAIYQWTPVIAASGMAFYTGQAFPQWQGDLFVGGLVSRGLVRLELDGTRVTDEERLPLGARIRDVRQGPDGGLYVLTDEENGKILRLSPG